jgi:hypothetical protein
VGGGLNDYETSRSLSIREPLLNDD